MALATTPTEARALGVLRYFTGRPCKHGHLSERLASTRGCCECFRLRPGKAEYASSYYRSNAGKLKERAQVRWRTSPDAKLQDKACRDKKRDKIRAYDRMRAKRDRAKKKIIIARWIESNRERHRLLRVATSQRRRARMKCAGGTWSASDVERALKAQRNTCWWCSKRLIDGYHVDHRFPLAREGTNQPNNIVISCPPCNFSKNARMPWEFAGRLL